MDFGFNEQQREVRALARKILSEQVDAQRLAAYDEYQQPRFDTGLWQQLAAAGLAGIPLAQCYGGMGYGFTELALLVEEVGRTIAPVPVITHCVTALAVQRFADQSIREAVLPAAAAGRLLLGAALTEPLNEEPATPVTVTARRDGKNLVLTGVKTAVAFGAQADRILLAARHGDEIALVLLDPQAAGVSLNPLEATTFEPQCNVVLDAARVPAADIICETGGAAAMNWLGQRVTAAICAHQLGAADCAMRMAASYTSERKQFEVPVATFQAVGHRVADCYIDIECLRLATYQAVSLLDSEQKAATEVQIAKIWAGDTGHRVSYATQHVHGGTGIDRDYPLWRYCLWLRQNEMTLGCSAAQVAALGRRLAAGEALFS